MTLKTHKHTLAGRGWAIRLKNDDQSQNIQHYLFVNSASSRCGAHSFCMVNNGLKGEKMNPGHQQSAQGLSMT